MKELMNKHMMYRLLLHCCVSYSLRCLTYCYTSMSQGLMKCSSKWVLEKVFICLPFSVNFNLAIKLYCCGLVITKSFTISKILNLKVFSICPQFSYFIPFQHFTSSGLFFSHFGLSSTSPFFLAISHLPSFAYLTLPCRYDGLFLQRRFWYYP